MPVNILKGTVHNVIKRRFCCFVVVIEAMTKTSDNRAETSRTETTTTDRFLAMLIENGVQDYICNRNQDGVVFEHLNADTGETRMFRNRDEANSFTRNHLSASSDAWTATAGMTDRGFVLEFLDNDTTETTVETYRYDLDGNGSNIQGTEDGGGSKSVNSRKPKFQKNKSPHHRGFNNGGKGNHAGNNGGCGPGSSSGTGIGGS